MWISNRLIEDISRQHYRRLVQEGTRRASLWGAQPGVRKHRPRRFRNLREERSKRG